MDRGSKHYLWFLFLVCGFLTLLVANSQAAPAATENKGSLFGGMFDNLIGGAPTAVSNANNTKSVTSMFDQMLSFFQNFNPLNALQPSADSKK